MRPLMLQKNLLLSKCVILFGLLVFILNSQAYADSSADAKRIAHLMREIQARVTSLGWDEVAWPACLNGTPAPLYPADKFYDGETDDPARMAELVNAVRAAYFRHLLECLFIAHFVMIWKAMHPAQLTIQTQMAFPCRTRPLRTLGPLCSAHTRQMWQNCALPEGYRDGRSLRLSKKWVRRMLGMATIWIWKS